MSEVLQERVSILEKSYTIGCRAEERQALRDSARLLDSKMREIRENGKIIGIERIAVMAALNIAHELLQERTRERDYTVELKTRLKAMQDKIQAVLDDDDRQMTL